MAKPMTVRDLIAALGCCDPDEVVHLEFERARHRTVEVYPINRLTTETVVAEKRTHRDTRQTWEICAEGEVKEYHEVKTVLVLS